MLRRLTNHRLLSTASLLLATGLFIVSSTGCKSWGRWGLWDDTEFPDEEQKLTERVRPREPKSELFGASTRAQQIERNLGYGAE